MTAAASHRATADAEQRGRHAPMENATTNTHTTTNQNGLASVAQRLWQEGSREDIDMYSCRNTSRRKEKRAAHMPANPEATPNSVPGTFRQNATNPEKIPAERSAKS